VDGAIAPMQRVAFTMKLLPGFEAEYQRRHDAVWPELSALLHEAGVREYSIFLDPGSLVLFAYLQIADGRKLDQLASEPVMRRWWAYMKEVMETHPDDPPVTVALREVFYQP